MKPLNPHPIHWPTVWCAVVIGLTIIMAVVATAGGHP